MKRKKHIFADIVFILIVLTAIAFIKFDQERVWELKDGGMQDLYAYNMHSYSSYHKGHSYTSNYMDFRFTIEDEVYTVSISTEALGQGENYIVDLDGPNCIQRYVLYSKDFSVAHEEYISIAQYRRNSIFKYFLIVLGVILALIPPRFIERYFNKRVKPLYKNNPHSKDEPFLVAWNDAKNGAHYIIWLMLFASVVFIMVFLFVVENISIGFRIALAAIFLPLLILCPFLWRHLRKSFVAVYQDEIVYCNLGRADTVKRSDITGYSRVEYGDGKYWGYYFFTPSGKYFLGTDTFDEKLLEAFLKEHRYVVR